MVTQERCDWCKRHVGESHDDCIFGEGLVTYGQASKPPVSDRPEPLDTSKLGPVRVDPNADAVKARIVREALRATGNYHLSIAAGLCDDAALVKLFMLLK